MQYVLTADTATYRYLEVLRPGTVLEVLATQKGDARTNRVATLKKEDGWGDWLVKARPKTADPTLLPDTQFGSPSSGFVSAKDLAAAITRGDVWASVKA